ncbi:hypothetical protein CRENBAI_011563 [Crenichthys baileyi]|uniref:Ig-like domain-containing protein n=1 Tax=Crenichthys baileyi TaxID=28760 RepID=A0AAV9RU51_9TELE
MPPGGAFLGRVFPGTPHREEGPGGRPPDTLGGTMSLGWPGNALGAPGGAGGGVWGRGRLGALLSLLPPPPRSGGRGIITEISAEAVLSDRSSLVEHDEEPRKKRQKKRTSHQIILNTNMFSVALLLLLLATGCCVKCEQLTQPASLNVQPGQRLTIRCQVSYSLGSYTAWIRQPAGKGLEWIGMKYTGASYYKDSLKNQFSIDLDSSSNTVTLNGQNMQPEDSAVYYCAREPRSYTWPDSVSTCDNFLERGIVRASAGNNLMLTLYR